VGKQEKGDMRALEDLTYDRRKEFIERHGVPEGGVPIVSFHSEASYSPGMIATMSHVAHTRLPSSRLWLVPVVLPVSAVMALCALHIQLRYGEKSDGLVTCRDAEVPGSVVVKPDAKLDHSWMVYSSPSSREIRKKAAAAAVDDASVMCEALLTMIV
ncbi:hypothetical protein M569_16547, partial [Genlisea aurea]